MEDTILKSHYKCIALVVLYATVITAASCPDNCKTGEVCNDEDGGCDHCKEAWFGRHCEHALECYTGYGYNYKGTANVTVNNVACQHWSSQTPNTHAWNSLQSEMNYCRNPNPVSEERIPWCYQMDGARSGACIVPKCDTQCPVPTLYPFGDVINPPSSGFAVGVTIEVITGGCGPGKRGFMTCQNDKTWSTTNCTEMQCNSPSLKAHSSISPPKSIFKFRDIITIVCNTGYKLQGNNTMSCQADNTWSAVSYTCTKNECPYPNINPNSRIQITKSVFQYEDVITFQCNHGYAIEGSSQIACQANKTWSAESPFCKIVECMAPTLPNTTRITNAKDKYIHGDVITLSCTEGHTLTHENTSVCQATAQWSEPFPACLVVQCMAPNLPNTTRITNAKDQYLYGDVVTMSCSEGHELVQGNGSVCQATAQWSEPFPVCSVNECPYPNINPNSKIQITQPVFQYGDVVTFHCDHGYAIQGSSQLTCQANKTWNMESPSCKIVECKAPNLPNTMRITNARDKYYHDDVITLSCTEGYKLVQGNTSVCQASQWSEPFPVCSGVECGKLKLTSHLVISKPVKNIYTFKDTLSFSCDKGYELSHDIVIVCQANKEWNSTLLPMCVANEVLTTTQWIGTTVGVVLVCILILVVITVFFIRRFKGVIRNPITTSSSTAIHENKAFIYDEIDKTKDQSNVYSTVSE